MTKRMLWALAIAACPLAAAADTYPAKPIRMIVPFAAGGPTDVVARALADHMGKALGQTLVIDNRGGAGGAIGTEAVVKSKGDGYTIGLATASTHQVVPACNRGVGYDPVKDFRMVGLIATVPGFLYVKADSKYRGMKDLIEAAKKEPGAVTWGTTGQCSNTHLNLEMINKLSGAKIAMIPYKGNSQAAMDLLAGQVTMASDAMTPASVDLIRAGKIRPVARYGKTDDPLMKGVPTYKELGLADAEMVIWQGLVAPPDTPDAVVARLNDALRKALAQPELRKYFLGNSIVPEDDPSPEKMRAFIAKEYAVVVKLVDELSLATASK